MSERVSCLVPGCRRTTSLGIHSGEWICDRHWRSIPNARRRVLARIVRQYRRRFGRADFWDYPAGSVERLAAVRLNARWRRMWARTRREAIETAFMDPTI